MRGLAKWLVAAAVVCAFVALAGVAVTQHRTIDRLETADDAFGDEVSVLHDELKIKEAEIELLGSSIRSARDAVDRLDRQLATERGDLRDDQTDVDEVASMVDDLAAEVRVASNSQRWLTDCLAWIVAELGRVGADGIDIFLPPNSCRTLQG